jgi:hypothetical protein
MTRQHNQHISLTNCKYDSSSRITSFTHVGDYGFNVELPGEWKYIGFDKNGRDNIFSDSLKQRLFIFSGSRGSSSFNKFNLDGDDFIGLFYKWDSEWYLANNTGLTTRVIERSSGKFLIAEYVDSAYVSTSLYGTKNGNGIRISIVSKSNRTSQTEFVSTVYSNLR